MHNPGDVNPTKPPTLALRLSACALMLGGLFLCALAVRWHWITEFCAQLPFWDEWLDDAPLFRAYQTGTLTWEQLVAPFNGHRLLFQRLIKLGLFLWNDRQWDSQMQATVFAVFGSAVPVLLATMFSKVGARVNYAVWAVISLIWLSPVLWYNATWAFQLCMYLQLLCTLGGLALLMREDAWRWVGVALLVAAHFTLASGFLGAAAAGAAIVGAAWRNRAISRSRLVLVILCGLIVVAGFALQFGAGGAPDGFKARSIWDFVRALGANFSWPLALEAPDGSIYYIGMLLWIPAPLALGLWMLRRRELPDLPRGGWELLLALTLWVYGQLAMIALMRGVDGRGPSWRHYEFHAVGIVLNVVALTLLWQVWSGKRRLMAWASAAFAGLVILGTAMQWNLATQVMELRRGMNIAQENTVREFLVTGDAERLRNRAVFETPFMFLGKPEELLRYFQNQASLPASVDTPPIDTGDMPDNRTYVSILGADRIPPLAADKFQFAKVYSNWPPSFGPFYGLRLADTPFDGASTRFKWIQIHYLSDPKARLPNFIEQAVEKPSLNGHLLKALNRPYPFRFHEQRFYLNGDPKYDWNTLILRNTQFEVGLQDRDSWVAVSAARGLGSLSAWCRGLRATQMGIGAVGVLLLALGIARSQGWGLLKNTQAAPHAAHAHSHPGDPGS